MNRPLIIISGCGPLSDSAATIERVVAEQCGRLGLDCWWIPHLYHLSETSRLWEKLTEIEGKIVLFCRIHPRPAEWILRRHGIDVEQWTIFNLSNYAEAEEAVRVAIEQGAIEHGARGTEQVGERSIRKWEASSRQPPPSPASSRRSPPSPPVTPPSSAMVPTGKMRRSKETVGERWYPVMDGSRCVNCGHCLQFCLFGVYELNAEGQVEVRNPDQCKTGCPACSRICPQSAIMFPLYEKDAAISGAPGQYVALDAAARKMFYTRTKQPCPKCGAVGDRKSKATGPLCPECGRPCNKRDNAPAEGRAAFDDLDALVDRLDQKMQRRG